MHERFGEKLRLTLTMVTIVPVAGKYIVQWFWGGYTISNPTLNRFFSLHFLLPFIIAGLTLIHLALLHKEGSNNPIGSDKGVDDVPFYPYFVSKDIFALSCFLLFFAFFVFYLPNTLNHPDNYIVRLHSYIKSFGERNSKINFISL
jgi:quinol-cytochrome oxidoreductase complex cytochrome b subunit